MQLNIQIFKVIPKAKNYDSVASLHEINAQHEPSFCLTSRLCSRAIGCIMDMHTYCCMDLFSKQEFLEQQIHVVAHNSSQYCLQAANKNHGTPHSTPSPLTHSLLLVNVQHLNLRGVPVSHSHQCLLDIEFVDDIVVYMQGDMENRKKLESGLSLFSERSNTMINWHKSCAIWLYDDSHPTWCRHPSFMWINQ